MFFSSTGIHLGTNQESPDCDGTSYISPNLHLAPRVVKDAIIEIATANEEDLETELKEHSCS